MFASTKEWYDVGVSVLECFEAHASLNWD
jgi:hypothetical protein